MKKNYRYQIKDKNDFTCMLVSRVNASIFLGDRPLTNNEFKLLAEECGCPIDQQVGCGDIMKALPYLHIFEEGHATFDNGLKSVAFVMDKIVSGYAVVIELNNTHDVFVRDVIGKFRLLVIDTWRKQVDVRKLRVSGVIWFSKHDYTLRRS